MKKALTVLFILTFAAIVAVTAAGCSFRGASAYEIAVRAGYSGTEEQWLETLKGDKGADGQNFNAGYTAYELYEEAVANGGYSGTFLDFISEYFGSDPSSSVQAAVSEAVFSVVSVYCKFPVSSGRFSQTYYATSAGSGVIYSIDKTKGDALIITNYHVVYSSYSLTSNKIASEIKIYLYGNETSSGAISCEYVGGTSEYDIAVLKVSSSPVVSSSNAKAAVFADSDEVCLGQSVIAIGNPEAEGISVTQGILSVESENISMSDVSGDKNSIRVLRYDAAVNPGNSGGGLFNASGELVGIVNAKTVDEEIDDMNYAIPSNTVSGVVNGIINYCLGKSETSFYRAYFGVITTIVSTEGRYNATRKCAETVETVAVESVSNGTLAYGKLMAGDRLVSVKYAGKTKQITRSYQLIDVILSLNVNDEVIFTVVRNGVTKDVSITVTQSCMTKVS
ncbi:MAG: serine protease [Clostridia bacterium]|nr:serine protease [Clostridia bacterium]